MAMEDTLCVSDFPVETPISSGFPIATRLIYSKFSKLPENRKTSRLPTQSSYICIHQIHLHHLLVILTCSINYTHTHTHIYIYICFFLYPPLPSCLLFIHLWLQQLAGQPPQDVETVDSLVGMYLSIFSGFAIHVHLRGHACFHENYPEYSTPPKLVRPRIWMPNSSHFASPQST